MKKIVYIILIIVILIGGIVMVSNKKEEIKANIQYVSMKEIKTIMKENENYIIIDALAQRSRLLQLMI